MVHNVHHGGSTGRTEYRGLEGSRVHTDETRQRIGKKRSNVKVSSNARNINPSASSRHLYQSGLGRGGWVRRGASWKGNGEGDEGGEGGREVNSGLGGPTVIGQRADKVGESSMRNEEGEGRLS